MYKDQAAKFLKLLGCKVPLSQPRSKWCISDCPMGPWRHDDGKSAPVVFGVRAEPGDSLCHCFSCGWSGSQAALVIEMGRLNKFSPQGSYPFAECLQLIAQAEEAVDIEGLDGPTIEDVLLGEKKGPHVFPDWWLDSFISTAGVPWAEWYLTVGREGCDPVSPQVLSFLDVRADTEQKRVCFPVRDFHKRLMGLHGRSTQQGVEPRYRMYTQAGRNNHEVWLGEHWVDFTRPVVAVEGPFDLASVMRVYRNVVSPLFSNPSFEKMARMGDVMEWVTFLDRGTGGDKGRERFGKAYKDNPVAHVQPPKGCKDPAACSVQQLQDALGPHVQLDDTLA